MPLSLQPAIVPEVHVSKQKNIFKPAGDENVTDFGSLNVPDKGVAPPGKLTLSCLGRHLTTVKGTMFRHHLHLGGLL